MADHSSTHVPDPPVAPQLAVTGSDRIVIRGVNWLGDAVMTTPALLQLRAAHPGAHIALLTHEKLADLWRHHPSVNEVIPLPAGAGVFEVARLIRAGEFRIGLLFPNSHRSALELWMAGVPRRVGVGVGVALRRVLLTHPVSRSPGHVPMRKRSPSEIRRLAGVAKPAGSPPVGPLPPQAHHIHHYLHLVSALGASDQPLPPRLVVAEAEVRDAVRKFAADFEDGTSLSTAPDAAPVLGLCPAAEYGPAKRWPARNFVAAARELSGRIRCRWLILGGSADVPLADEVARGIGGPVRNVAGKTSLRELMALLGSCRVVLTNDTGPMHLAAAVGTRVAAIFGSTSPEMTGPGLPGDTRHWLVSSNASCSPCFLRECPIDFRCMKGISVSQVVSAVLELHSQRQTGN